MLTIRPDQMAVFRALARRSFLDRLLGYLAAELPAHHQALGEEGMRRLIDQGIAAAGRHGIEDEGPLAALIELMVEYGVRLERAPDRAWAERMLARRELPAPVRVSAVRERLSASAGGRRLTVVPPPATVSASSAATPRA